MKEMPVKGKGPGLPPMLLPPRLGTAFELFRLEKAHFRPLNQCRTTAIMSTILSGKTSFLAKWDAMRKSCPVLPVFLAIIGLLQGK